MDSASRRRVPGRPSKCTPAVLDRLVTAVRSGVSMDAAAEFAGIAPSTLYSWLAQAKQADARREFLELSEALTRTRAELQVRTVSLVMKKIAGGTELTRTRRIQPDGTVEIVEVERTVPPDGRLGLDLLSRLFPSDFGRRRVPDATSSSSGPALLSVSPERLLDLAARVHAAQNSEESDSELGKDTSCSGAG